MGPTASVGTKNAKLRYSQMVGIGTTPLRTSRTKRLSRNAIYEMPTKNSATVFLPINFSWFPNTSDSVGTYLTVIIRAMGNRKEVHATHPPLQVYVRIKA